MTNWENTNRRLWEQFLVVATKIRYFEEAVRELIQQGKLAGLVHLSIGQEAIAAGVCQALRPDDTIASTHRGHGHIIAKGADLSRMFAELLGRESGYCRGRGGSMHIADLSLGILGANGIVAGGIPLAVGAAYAHQRQATDRVSVAFFGDGAVNQGAFHESLNLAAVWQLPAIFVCENNGHADSVAQSRHQRQLQISLRAQGYGISGLTIDGNDTLAVYQAASQAVERARKGNGPTLIECLTYRHYSHQGAQPNPLGSRPVDGRINPDPLSQLAEQFDYLHPPGSERRSALQAEIKAEIQQAISVAETAVDPSPDQILSGVYGARIKPPSPPKPGDRRLTMAAAIEEALIQVMEADDRISYVGEDLEVKTAPKGYPKGRVRDTPISEAAIVGLGTGAALAGERPVVDIMSADFSTIAMDQIVNQAAKIRFMLGGQIDVPLVIRIHIGGTENTAAQHSQSLEAWFTHVPGLTVVYPATPYQAKGMFLTALADPNPVICLESRQMTAITGPVPAEMYQLPMGRASILRAGEELTIIAIGPLIQPALAAAKSLEESDGISLEVIDPVCLQPLDTKGLASSVRKTGRLIIVHQAVIFGGLGAEIASQIGEQCFDHLRAPIVRLGAPFAPPPFAPVLEKEYQPSQPSIMAAVRKLLAQ
ncbi:MAG: thiamine pyrophosphate-dependent enzyme [Candidatus Poribacteria bacterium]|nr:thiamine pyrophosphate-dependent enzyme [Candidatus Poribacteria bacterium]